MKKYIVKLINDEKVEVLAEKFYTVRRVMYFMIQNDAVISFPIRNILYIKYDGAVSHE